uniref:glucan endo-1,3-beta-D-glucosidase n=1 Tax=Globisporangium ultimum (strain ATCC 200006 / CBS 805.95 / DAOM BR144) TaxID=431595 RepID=K3WI69_GLOUD
MAGIKKLFSLVAALALGAASAYNESSSVGIHRNLGAGSGDIAACYTPFHSWQYPVNGGGADVNALRQSIDDDFRLMSKHVTYVRTYYAQHFGIEIAPIAAKYNIKLYLGVFLTKESWGASEVTAAVNAVNNYPGTVEAIIVGNENMINHDEHSWDILNKINEIKSRLGGNAGRVKYGTVQRVTEYLDSNFDSEMWQLANNLDILGVNIYPFFDNGYDASRPTDLLNTLWNMVGNKYPRDKLRLTETGFPTAGSSSSVSPRVQPSLAGSVNYYEGVVDWNPAGYAGRPKFWFQAFDRRWDDKTVYVELERHFGFFTVDKQYKQGNFPHPLTASSSNTGSCNLENGIDYSGNDIGSAWSASAANCCGICKGFQGCKAFSWNNYNGGTCWLKSGKGSWSNKSGVISAVIDGAASSNGCNVEKGIDYSGNDIGSTWSADAANCCGICKDFQGCKAFSWNNYNGGTCWLKSGKGGWANNGGTVSAVVA